MANPSPLVGHWYREVTENFIFEVVALDDKDATIEVQRIDGELDEFDRDSWRQLLVETIEEPDDWRNPFEISREDSLDPDQALIPDNWDDPFDAAVSTESLDDIDLYEE